MVYKYRLPAFWFFSSVSGVLMRKKSGNVVGPTILDSFTKRPTCGAADAPCAVHIYCESKGVSTVQFFDSPGLHEFINNCEKQPDGVLQRFVAPRGSAHSVIRATWTPALCLLERRTNRHALGDTHSPLPSRCLTFEGREAEDSVSDPIHSPALAERVRGAANAIVSHVSKVTHGGSSIVSAVFHFTLGSDDALYFLHASSLRLRPDAAQARSATANAARPKTTSPKCKPQHLPCVYVPRTSLVGGMDLDPVYRTSADDVPRPTHAPATAAAAAAAAAPAMLSAAARIKARAEREAAAVARARARTAAFAAASTSAALPVQPPFRGGRAPPPTLPVARARRASTGSADGAPVVEGAPSNEPHVRRRTANPAAIAALAVPRPPPPPPAYVPFAMRPVTPVGVQRSEPSTAAPKALGVPPPAKPQAALYAARRKPSSGGAPLSPPLPLPPGTSKKAAAAIALAVAQARAASDAGKLGVAPAPPHVEALLGGHVAAIELHE